MAQEMIRESPIPVPDSGHELPASSAASSRSSPRWNEATERIGGTLGRAVVAAREMPLRAEQVRSELRDRLQVIRGRGPEGGPGKAEQLQQAAERHVAVLKSRASERLHLARNRAERTVREHPLEMILAAFGAAFVLGAALRIWRSTRD